MGYPSEEGVQIAEAEFGKSLVSAGKRKPFMSRERPITLADVRRASSVYVRLPVDPYWRDEDEVPDQEAEVYPPLESNPDMPYPSLVRITKAVAAELVCGHQSSARRRIVGNIFSTRSSSPPAGQGATCTSFACTSICQVIRGSSTNGPSNSTMCAGHRTCTSGSACPSRARRRWHNNFVDRSGFRRGRLWRVPRRPRRRESCAILTGSITGVSWALPTTPETVACCRLIALEWTIESRSAGTRPSEIQRKGRGGFAKGCS